MRDAAATVNGEYIMYCDKPFVRENNTICYGDMTDDYVLFMMILTNKTVDGAGGKKVEIPDQILVQVLSRGQVQLSNLLCQGCLQNHLYSRGFG